MDLRNSTRFGIVDYCVFVGMLIFSAAIGLYSSWIGNKTPKEFLLGNGDFKPLPVAMSLLATFVSCFSILGYSGEVYADGMQVSTMILGAILAILFSLHFVLPVFYPLNIISITEYVELRFESKCLRHLISILLVMKNFVFMGINLYAPAIALEPSINLDPFWCIVLLGMICTLYSACGGFRAVIWTDVLQLSTILIGLLTVTAIGCFQNGGLIKILYIASEGERLEIFDMNPSPFVRHTFMNTIAFGFFLQGSGYTCVQLTFQRLWAVKCIEDAKRVLMYNVYGISIVFLSIFAGGLVAFASYYGCDPLALGIIKRKEQIMIHFVSDKLNFIPGLSGLFVAALVAGTLSTISSLINSTVALIWKDVCLKIFPFQNASMRFATITNQALSFIVGIIMIGLAILASKAHSLIEVGTTFSGPLLGSIFGLYLVALIMPRCNMKGVWAGAIIPLVFTMWLALGGLYFKKSPTPLPLTADDCSHMNYTSVNASKVMEFSQRGNNITEERSNHSLSFTDVYQISYTLYAPMATLMCILLAAIVSFLTGNKKIEEVSPTYISPPVRRFYWTKEQLELVQKDEIKIHSYNIRIDEGKDGQHETISVD